ncbi:Fur family transcriptional regulator [[Clostridium] aminophilum]|uniref:Fur family transcriptional regulator, peroxide stress response regulator n=1 Tax=[Clostridium] aminophilum TaxID=1526 RepID=A0A1I6KMF9_9FIRM|nr:transcriptional repressor [[Clostridium] aminophilum]SFR92391.1 Fur family transcriptional regulator, peroxide stress response regulator [[Clostridium] aminophilum]
MQRLNHSRQREAIMNCLAHRFDHPTADMLYHDIQKIYPKISLGTVYRNLNLLSDMGMIQRFSTGDGNEHYDANTQPHYHFVCRECGAVRDIHVVMRSSIISEVAPYVDGKIDSAATFFYGKCGSCLNSKEIENNQPVSE